MKSIHLRVSIVSAMVAVALITLAVLDASAQGRRRPAKRPAVCGNPQVPCKTAINFKDYDLPFQLPENAVIYDTDLFYAVILKSVKAIADECDVFVPESDRLAAQGLFRTNKVFTSRCYEPGEVGYSNTSPNAHFMAVYAGTTSADANRMLAKVKATGKFTGAWHSAHTRHA